MATRAETYALERVVRDLLSVSDGIVAQAMAVTDLVVRRRLIARAGQLVNIAAEIRGIIE